MTTDPDPGAAGGSHSIEVELKFDVDDDTPLPHLSGLPGVASVGDAEARDLDALYLDSADHALAHAGYALRRRTGGPDEGWHVKGPRRADGGRVELQWPLDEGGSEGTAVVPPAILAHLTPLTSAPLAPLARIRNARTAYALFDARGDHVAEFVDDRVVATDERAGVERHWREWEFELGPAAPDDTAALMSAVERAVRDAGGREAASDSKLARALGA